MLFDSMTFLWIFLPIILILYFIVKEKNRNILLILASLIFYAWGDAKNLVVLLFSILINYIISLRISISRKRIRKKYWLILGMAIDIGILIYYKYFSFIAQNINIIFGIEILSSNDLELPIGISFFTFSELSYLFDIYKGNIKNKINLISTSLYISFFPKLIMGPIERYCNFEEQIYNRVITIEKCANGIKRFVYGLSKKVIIANAMGSIADSIFNFNIEIILHG